MLVYLGYVCVILQLAASQRSTYHRHKVLEIVHKTEDDFIKLLNMELKYELDFWKMPKHVNDSMYVRIGPHYLQSFLNELKSMSADVSILIDNVHTLMDSHRSSNIQRKYLKQARRSSVRAGSGVDLYVYHDFNSIMNYLDKVASQQLSINATVHVLGQSIEGRDIKMIKLSSPYGSAQKRGIFIDGGIHAREWVAPAIVLYMIEQMAYNPENDNDIYEFFTQYDIYLVPLVNPDGYAFSNEHTRLWRKNRRNNGGSCPGVDLNRNFPYQWNPAVGGSNNPCSDIYSGTGGASEPETQAIVNFLQKEKNSIDAYLTIHSYGQMWLYPWGYTSALPDDYQDLDDAAKAGVAAIKSVNHQRYAVGSSTNVLYAAAGGSDDYAKGGAGIKYAYTLELRDTGRYGFVLPESLIGDTAQEFFSGFIAFYNHIKSK